MFSSMQKEEYKEFSLSSIFQVKVVAKNINLESLGTKSQAVSAVWWLFLKKHTNFLNQTVTLSAFLVTQYTSLIYTYVKKKPFSLVNWAFLFVGPLERISSCNIAKLFQSIWWLRPWKVNSMVPHQKGSCDMRFWQENTCELLCGLKIRRWANFSTVFLHTVFMKILQL